MSVTKLVVEFAQAVISALLPSHKLCISSPLIQQASTPPPSQIWSYGLVQFCCGLSSQKWPTPCNYLTAEKTSQVWCWSHTREVAQMLGEPQSFVSKCGIEGKGESTLLSCENLQNSLINPRFTSNPSKRECHSPFEDGQSLNTYCSWNFRSGNTFSVSHVIAALLKSLAY